MAEVSLDSLLDDIDHRQRRLLLDIVTTEDCRLEFEQSLRRRIWSETDNIIVRYTMSAPGEVPRTPVGTQLMPEKVRECTDAHLRSTFDFYGIGTGTIRQSEPFATSDTQLCRFRSDWPMRDHSILVMEATA